jgi:hypothetical protein
VRPCRSCTPRCHEKFSLSRTLPRVCRTRFHARLRAAHPRARCTAATYDHSGKLFITFFFITYFFSISIYLFSRLGGTYTVSTGTRERVSVKTITWSRRPPPLTITELYDLTSSFPCRLTPPD